MEFEGAIYIVSTVTEMYYRCTAIVVKLYFCLRLMLRVMDVFTLSHSVSYLTVPYRSLMSSY